MNQIEFEYMIKISIFIATVVVGLVQWVKNFVKTDRKVIYSVISIILIVAISFLNTTLVPEWITVSVDLILLALATSQLCWDILAKAIPKMVKNFFDKIITSRKE